MPGPILEFGDFRLDCDRFELSRGERLFRLEHKPMELLILLATREGDVVTRSEIAARLWGIEVFVDTEHGINTAIRKVRQVLRDDPDHPRFVHTVTGRGYRFVGPVIRGARTAPAPSLDQPVVPPELSASAPVATALIPESAPLAGQSSDVPQHARIRSWLLPGFIVALFLIIVVATLLFREHTTHASSPAIQSLAVLPLENLSGDSKQDYFADGMTDELTTMLAKESTLRVVSRTSAMQFKDPHRPLREVAGSLGVDGIVEGSISRADGKVHMTLQLIHAPSDTHLWADSYDRDNHDVAVLPEEAAQAIAKRLNASVASIRPARYVSPAAHDAYLQGKFHLFTGADGGGEFFKKAVAIQPDYAAAWAGLAQYYGSGSASNLDPRQVFGPMMDAARRAVALDDTLPEAHVALGEALFYAQWDWAGGERETRRAIQLDPEYSEAHHRLAEMLAPLNRHQEAIAEQKIATELDPFERPRAMAYLYQLARQYDDALADLKQRLATKPDDGGLLFTLADVYRCNGMFKKWAETWFQIPNNWTHEVDAEAPRRLYARGGYKAVLRGHIANEERRSKLEYVSPVTLALFYGELKQKEKTLDLLEEGLRIHDSNVLYIQCDPAFDFLHNDPRYRAVINRIGLPHAW